MDEMPVTVTGELDDGTEKEIEVYVNLDNFSDFDSNKDKIKYVKELAKKQSEDIKKVLFDKDDLKDLEAEIDDMNDTSWAHPNETYGEFMEHEDYE